MAREGGSYLVGKDGELILLERTQPADSAAPIVEQVAKVAAENEVIDDEDAE